MFAKIKRYQLYKLLTTLTFKIRPTINYSLIITIKVIGKIGRFQNADSFKKFSSIYNLNVTHKFIDLFVVLGSHSVGTIDKI